MEKKSFSFVPVTPQVGPRPIALDLKGLFSDVPINVSLFQLDVSSGHWEWCQALQPPQGLLSLSPAELYEVPWLGLGRPTV